MILYIYIYIYIHILQFPAQELDFRRVAGQRSLYMARPASRKDNSDDMHKNTDTNVDSNDHVYDIIYMARPAAVPPPSKFGDGSRNSNPYHPNSTTVPEIPTLAIQIRWRFHKFRPRPSKIDDGFTNAEFGHPNLMTVPQIVTSTSQI